MYRVAPIYDRIEYQQGSVINVSRRGTMMTSQSRGKGPKRKQERAVLEMGERCGFRYNSRQQVGLPLLQRYGEVLVRTRNVVLHRKPS